MTRRALGIAVLIAAISLPASAMWGPAEIEELVRWSDVIVVGTLRDVHEKTRNGMDYGQGKIVVSEVLWGSCNPGDRLDLRWENRTGLACPRVENAPHQDKPGIWLLNHGEHGTVTANYPRRFQNLDQLPAIRKLLNAYRLRIRVDRMLPGAVLTVTVRNSGHSPMTIPWFTSNDQGLSFGPGITLKVFDGFHAHGRVLDPKPNHLTPDSARVVVVGGTEVAFQTTLIDLYDLYLRHDYSLSIEIPGAGPAATDNFWVYPPGGPP